MHSSQRTQGTGLGHPIARTIIESYGGIIWVENRMRGAVFCFTLPFGPRRITGGESKRSTLLSDSGKGIPEESLASIYFYFCDLGSAFRLVRMVRLRDPGAKNEADGF